MSILEKIREQREKEAQIIPKDNFQKYWLKIPMIIRYILVVPAMLITFPIVLVQLILEAIWNNKYYIIGIIGICAASYYYLVGKYGAHRLSEAMKALCGGILLIIIIKYFFAILSMIFWGGVLYLIYWAVMHALVG